MPSGPYCGVVRENNVKVEVLPSFISPEAPSLVVFLGKKKIMHVMINSNSRNIHDGK